MNEKEEERVGRENEEMVRGREKEKEKEKKKKRKEKKKKIINKTKKLRI